MKELKPCPFCGKTEHLEVIKLEDSMHPKHYKVTCAITSGGCGGIGGYRFSKQEAIEAWNARYEPTCHMVREDCAPDEAYPVYPFRCTACGEYADGYENYPYGLCPNCGAKVVGE